MFKNNIIQDQNKIILKLLGSDNSEKITGAPFMNSITRLQITDIRPWAILIRFSPAKPLLESWLDQSQYSTRVDL